MRTLGTFARPGSFAPTASAAGADVLVGRKVANSSFIRALLRHGTYDRYCFFVGETADLAGIEPLLEGLGSEVSDRVEARPLVNLPESLAAGDISAIHQNSPGDQLGQLLRLRDRYATSTVPVTGQIHSLSYPSMMLDFASSWLGEPSSCDAVFCSSTAGREVLSRCFEAVGEQLGARGLSTPAPGWELPVVPLGIDVDALEAADRSAARAQLNIPEDAFVILGIARFTEFDKMDLFPVLKSFSDLVRATEGKERPPVLLLAGARQGTKTPEMLQLWSRGMRIEDRLILKVDFADDEKARLLAAADVFISPSDNPQETFGITVVEALAAGLPVIAADLNGYKDTVSEDVGIRVPTYWNADLDAISELGPILYQRPLHLLLGQAMEVDLAALTGAMLTLYSEPARREAMGRAAAQRARAKYDWSVVIPQYEEVWNRLSEEPFAPRSREAHPLNMDFKRVFGHYPTAAERPAGLVQRSELARACCADRNTYPIYPDLKSIFDNDQVLAGVQLAATPIEVSELENKLREVALPGAPWRASLLVAWLLKHGLIERTT